VRLRTIFEHDDLELEHQPRDFRIAHDRGDSVARYRIERSDYSSAIQGQSDYLSEPPSNWASTSRCNPALQREHVMTG